MVRVETQISWGYLPLIEIFGKANSLVLKFEPRHQTEPPRQFITILYEEDSDTALTISFLSVRNLGFENMLCDYLKRCNVSHDMISIGQVAMRKSDEQLEKEWQEHRKKIGLCK